MPITMLLPMLSKLLLAAVTRSSVAALSAPSSSSGCGFVSRRSHVAMTPIRATATTARTTSSLTMTKREYSAEWIDLLSPGSYSSSSPKLPSRIDPPRSGGVAFATPDNSRVFAFGGYAEVAGAPGSMPERYAVNDLWRFLPHSDESDWGWTKHENDGGGYVPPSRLATALAVLPNDESGGPARAVLLGGWDPQTPGTGGIILDDVSVLDMNALEWSRCVAGDRAGDDGGGLLAIPGGPTSRHVAVRLSMPRTGGGAGGAREDVVCLHNHRCDDHVLRLSTAIGGGGGHPAPRARGDPRATAGDAPSSRGLHCAASMRRSTAMAVFGGAARDGTMSNEAFVLDAESWTWTKLDTGDNDAVPAPRAGACLCPLDEDSVILFGGATPGDGGLVGLNDVWVLNVDLESGKGVWRCLIPHRDSDDGDGTLRPPGRNAATLNAIDVSKLLPNGILWKSESPAEGCKYYLLSGGWYPFRKTYNDVFLLRISS